MMNNAQQSGAWTNNGQINNSSAVPAWMNKPKSDAAAPNVDAPGY
jgi:hypothetical protein